MRISADDVAANKSQPTLLQWAQGKLFVLSKRPLAQGGASIFEVQPNGDMLDQLPAEYSVQSQVNIYGGGDYLATQQGFVFCNKKDGKVYVKRLTEENPTCLDPSGDALYADFTTDQAETSLIAVQEQPQEGQEPLHRLALLDPTGLNDVQIIHQGQDFYAAPRLSPDGKQLAWITWNHPHMPWESSQLWLADWDGQQLHNAKVIAGGEAISVVQPTWSADGKLYFCADDSGYWNLYGWDGRQAQAITQLEAEIGEPQWVFGMQSFVVLDDDSMISIVNQQGSQYCLHSQGNKHQKLDLPWTHFTPYLCTDGQGVFASAASPTETEQLVQIHPKNGTWKTLGDKKGCLNGIMQGQAISFTSKDQSTVHAFFYPACLGSTEETLPPLLVMCHSGPTSCVNAALNLKIQYWVQRGFAVVDVNYRGSTGLGRAYREALNGQWGAVDVADCVYAARFCVQQGWVDKHKLFIRGNSAGGFTALNALIHYPDFLAGASTYGVTDLEALTQHTIKFEAHILQSLVGPYPQTKERYTERSPLHQADKLNTPVIFFQGLKDPVVQPEQTLQLVEQLQKRGVPCECHTYAEEGHGFKQAETVANCLEKEHAFYRAVLKHTHQSK